MGGSVGDERLALDPRIRRRAQPGQPPKTKGAQTEGGGAPQGAALDRNQTGNTHLETGKTHLETGNTHLETGNTHPKPRNTHLETGNIHLEPETPI